MHERGTWDHPTSGDEDLSSAAIGPHQTQLNESDTIYHVMQMQLKDLLVTALLRLATFAHTKL